MTTREFAVLGVLGGQGRVSGKDEEGQLAEDKSILVSQSLPPYAEMARLGEGWSVMNTAAIASLVVRPSTVAMGTLWNGEVGDNAKSYIIDRAFAHNLVGVANSGFGIWLCVHKKMTAPTADITAIRGNTGKAYNGAAIYDVGATVGDDGWFPWGNSIRTVTITVPGGQVEVLVEGRLIVPPGAGISITVVADTVGVTMTPGFSWWERKLTLS